MISKLRSEGKKVAAAAPTGIAALLLNAGTTLHKMFRLPVPLVENSTSTITTTSKKADDLREIDVFMFDEGSSISKYSVQAVNLLLQDVMNNNIEFGNKIIVTGDFRQTLPVVPRSGPAQIIEACLKSSPLWNFFKKHKLTKNMRAAPEEHAFADWLLTIGDGTATVKSNEPFKGCVKIPQEIIVPQNSSLIDAMYDVNAAASDFQSRAILTPNNKDSIDINEQILLRVPGEVKTYYSADDIITDDEIDRDAYPLEFINSQTPSGCPTHKLNLKVDAVVMLLRNLDLERGLCNGTRLIVTRLFQNCVEARS